MFGIFALFPERFMVAVRYLSAMGPRWCKWIGAILSGPSALLFGVSYSFFHSLTLKYMALFAGGLAFLDENFFTVPQSLEQLPL